MPLDCTLVGTAFSIPNPSPCTRPTGLRTLKLITGYVSIDDGNIDSTGSLDSACQASALTGLIPAFTAITVQTTSLSLFQVVYLGESTDCTLAPDGYYFTDQSANSGFIYLIGGGTILEIIFCSNPSTSTSSTTTTTTTISLAGSGHIVISTDDYIYTVSYPSNINLDIPTLDKIASFGLAISTNKLWSVETDFKSWDITLNPFVATPGATSSFPGGFTTSSGIFAINNTTLIGVNDSTSPQTVVELDVSGGTASGTDKFTLEPDRVAYGNPLYTTNGKLLIINQDPIAPTYYLSQYDYVTGDLEIDHEIGNVITDPISLINVNNLIYISDTAGNVFVITSIYPYAIVQGGFITLPYSPKGATQLAQYVNINLIATTTTTTTVL